MVKKKETVAPMASVVKNVKGLFVAATSLCPRAFCLVYKGQSGGVPWQEGSMTRLTT
jgi:hypothetical protein